MGETVNVTVDARGIARLVLNRPDKHNALDAGMMDALPLPPGRLGPILRCAW